MHFKTEFLRLNLDLSLDDMSTAKQLTTVKLAVGYIQYATSSRSSSFSSDKDYMYSIHASVFFIECCCFNFTQDCHATNYSEPTVDEKQDYDLLSLTETDNITTMKFKRQFDTCDGQDNKIEVW